MIGAHGLVKRYGSTMAVDDLSFSIRPGDIKIFTTIFNLASILSENIKSEIF